MNVEGFIETQTKVDYDKQTTIFKQIDFMLCESCFWCASSLSSSFFLSPTMQSPITWLKKSKIPIRTCSVDYCYRLMARV